MVTSVFVINLNMSVHMCVHKNSRHFFYKMHVRVRMRVRKVFKNNKICMSMHVYRTNGSAYVRLIPNSPNNLGFRLKLFF